MILAVLAFVGVVALVGGAVILLREKPFHKIEDRLDLLTGAGGLNAKNGQAKEASILAQPLDDRPGLVESFMERFGNFSLLFEQADTSLTMIRLLVISAATAAAGVAISVVARVHPVMMPLVGLLMGAMPLFWLLLRRKRRLKAFGRNCPTPSKCSRARSAPARVWRLASTWFPAKCRRRSARSSAGCSRNKTLASRSTKLSAP